MYKQNWIALRKADTANASEIIDRFNVFENWKKQRRLDDEADFVVQLGLETLYGDGEQIEARKCFDYALAIAARALDEKRYCEKAEEFWFPLNRGILNRVLVYARSLTGSNFEADLLRTAAGDIADWCNRFSGHFWDEMTKSYYLSAVRGTLIAGDIEFGRRLIKQRRAFTTLEEGYGLLREYSNRSKSDLSTDAEFLSRFDNFFDLVRDPISAPSAYITDRTMLRLELGILRSSLRDNSSAGIDWRSVVDNISA